MPGMTAFLDTLKYNSDGHVAVIVQVRWWWGTTQSHACTSACRHGGGAHASVC